MHKVILIDAASNRTEHTFETLAAAVGSCGPKMPVIYNGRSGYFELPGGQFAEDRFIETDEDFAQFRYAHLPPHLQAVSKRFYDLAEFIVLELPQSHQRSVALLDLLRSKDAAVRAKLMR
jgi:hypothetical protein